MAAPRTLHARALKCTRLRPQSSLRRQRPTPHPRRPPLATTHLTLTLFARFSPRRSQHRAQRVTCSDVRSRAIDSAHSHLVRGGFTLSRSALLAR